MPYVTSVERIGIEKGMKRGKLEGQIESILEMRFGEAGLALMPTIEAIKDLELLQKIRDVVKTAVTLDEVRQVLPS